MDGAKVKRKQQEAGKGVFKVGVGTGGKEEGAFVVSFFWFEEEVGGFVFFWIFSKGRLSRACFLRWFFHVLCSTIIIFSWAC